MVDSPLQPNSARYVQFIHTMSLQLELNCKTLDVDVIVWQSAPDYNQDKLYRAVVEKA